MKTIYQIDDILKEAQKFTCENGVYSAVYLTGDFDGNIDYGAGIMQIDIFPHVLSISNIDDGVWQAERKEEEVQKIIKIFETFDGKLPTEKELNSKLMLIGLWGEFTG